MNQESIDIFKGLGVEINLNSDDDFLKVKETLTRIGVASKRDNILYQSCHILHKKGRYAILHFKELFTLDGKLSNLSEGDIERRNAIVQLLEDWGLLEIVNPNQIGSVAPYHQIKIITFKDKDNWELVPKYNIGQKRTNQDEHGT